MSCKSTSVEREARGESDQRFVIKRKNESKYSLETAVADPDLELRGGGGGGFLSLALLAFLPPAIPFFYPKKGGPPLDPTLNSVFIKPS